MSNGLLVVLMQDFEVILSFRRVSPSCVCNRFDMFPSPRWNPSIRFSREVFRSQECQATCGREKSHCDAKPGHDFVWPIRHPFPGNSAHLRIDKKHFLDPCFSTSQLKTLGTGRVLISRSSQYLTPVRGDQETVPTLSGNTRAVLSLADYSQCR